MADTAYEFVREAAANDAVILFVGTKKPKQLKQLLKKQLVLVNTTSITVGWVVLLQTGILSKKRIARLKEIKQMEADGIFRSSS